MYVLNGKYLLKWVAEEDGFDHVSEVEQELCLTGALAELHENAR